MVGTLMNKIEQSSVKSEYFFLVIVLFLSPSSKQGSRNWGFANALAVLKSHFKKSEYSGGRL